MIGHLKRLLALRRTIAPTSRARLNMAIRSIIGVIRRTRAEESAVFRSARDLAEVGRWMCDPERLYEQGGTGEDGRVTTFHKPPHRHYYVVFAPRSYK